MQNLLGKSTSRFFNPNPQCGSLGIIPSIKRRWGFPRMAQAGSNCPELLGSVTFTWPRIHCALKEVRFESTSLGEQVLQPQVPGEQGIGKHGRLHRESLLSEKPDMSRSETMRERQEGGKQTSPRDHQPPGHTHLGDS